MRLRRWLIGRTRGRNATARVRRGLMDTSAKKSLQKNLIKIGVVLAIMAGAFYLALGRAPSAKLLASSKTSACRDELIQALETFKRDQGLAFEVSADDAQSIVETGAVTKGYTRNGVKMRFGFGLDGDAEGCRLVFHQRTNPDGMSDTVGDLASVPLQHCQCE
jgi:hypothetical protein